MKRKLLKTFLLAVGLLVGANALAYDTPSGYGVSRVFIGTSGSANANGIISSVTAEDFEDIASLPSAWNAGTVNSISLTTVEEIAKPAVNAKPTGVPTYVSGKTMRAYLRKGTDTGNCYANYNLGTSVSSGKLVFSSDLFESGNTSNVLIVRFLDSSGNPVLTLQQNSKSDGLTYYSYSIGDGGLTNVGDYTTWRTYVGMQIKDLVIDLTKGEASFSIDYIARRKIGSTTDYYRTQTEVSTFNIGTGKNIAKVEIGKPALSSTDLYFYMDNVSLYTLDTYSDLYSAAKAEYDTKVVSLDEDGQAYWNTNVTSAASITTAEQYKTAIADLPSTYLAAVKTQTTDGTDMSEVIPAGNSGWTCSQGNGPNSYGETGATETYGTNSANKFSTGDIMYQSITGLHNGLYEVQFYGIVNSANNVSTVSGSNLVQAFANTTNLEIDVIKQNACTPTDYLRTIQTVVNDGTLRYGLKVKDEVTDAGNWAVAKAYKVIYVNDGIKEYTINYTCGGSIIKSETSSALLGSVVNATYSSTLWNDGHTQKYYVSDNATTSFTIASSDNTFEVVLREAINDAAASVDAVDANGTVLKTFYASGNGVEGEPFDGYVYYTRVVKKDGNYYVIPAASNVNYAYAKNGLTYGTPAKVVYTLDETIAYYSEVEDLNKSRGNGLDAIGQAPERASGGDWRKLYGHQNGGNAYLYTTSGVLEAGEYSLEISARGESNGDEAQKIYIQVLFSDNSTIDIDVLTWTQYSNEIKTVNNIIIPENASVKLYHKTLGTSGVSLDYIILRKTGDAEVSAAITSAGWATFISAYDLDFTTPIEGLTVYKAASATASTITLEEVTGKVKAGNGLVLKGDAGSYSIPVTTSATTIYEAPETIINMWGNTDTTDKTVNAAESGTNFVLALQDEKVVFAPIKGTTATLKPGQAALWANVNLSEARVLNVVFADEATGISAVQNSKEQSDEVYNLAGQRVAQPAKGLYIVNGKKVIMK